MSKTWIRPNEDAWIFLNHDLSVNQYEVEGINLYEWEEPPYLLTDFFTFLDSWTDYIRTFENVYGKAIVFPIALKK